MIIRSVCLSALSVWVYLYLSLFIFGSFSPFLPEDLLLTPLPHSETKMLDLHWIPHSMSKYFTLSLAWNMSVLEGLLLQGY